MKHLIFVFGRNIKYVTSFYTRFNLQQLAFFKNTTPCEYNKPINNVSLFMLKLIHVFQIRVVYLLEQDFFLLNTLVTGKSLVEIQ